MKKPSIFRRQLSFSRRIYLLYFLLVCLLIGAFFVFNYFNVKKMIYGSVQASMCNDRNQTITRLCQTFDSAYYANNQIYNSQEFQGMNPLTHENKRENAQDILSYFDLKKAFGYVERAYNDCDLRIYVNDKILYANEKVLFYPISSIEDENWYQESIQTPNLVRWHYTNMDGSPSIACTRMVYHGGLSYLIYSGISATRLSSIIANPYTDVGGFSILTDGENTLYSPNAELKITSDDIQRLLNEPNETNEYQKIEIQGQSLLYMRCKVNNVYLFYFLPQLYLSSSLNVSLQMSMFFIGCCLILAVFSAHLIGRVFLRRVQTLVEHMESVDSNGFSNLLKVQGNDEISLIERKYNEMCVHLQHSMENLQTAYKQRRKSELQALQAQINPHFLYNTLDAINWMALDAEQDNIAEMVSSLGRFFRLSLSKGKEIITIKEEVEIAREYAKLQHMRNEDSVEITFDVEEACLQTPCIKMLIQPIIENSIKHGKPANENRKLKVSVKIALASANRVRLSIVDNGVGLKDIPSEYPQAFKSGYGLKNVQERIQLSFGSSSLFRIKNNEETEGVCVTIEWDTDTEAE